MITDPFIIEQILIDNYSDIAKWYRYESHRVENLNLCVTLTFSSLDEHEFRMDVSLIYDEDVIKTIINHNKTFLSAGRYDRYKPIDNGFISIYGDPGKILETISMYIKIYDRNSKIDTLLT